MKREFSLLIPLASKLKGPVEGVIPVHLGALTEEAAFWITALAVQGISALEEIRSYESLAKVFHSMEKSLPTHYRFSGVDELFLNWWSYDALFLRGDFHRRVKAALELNSGVAFSYRDRFNNWKHRWGMVHSWDDEGFLCRIPGGGFRRFLWSGIDVGTLLDSPVDLTQPTHWELSLSLEAFGTGLLKVTVRLHSQGEEFNRLAWVGSARK